MHIENTWIAQKVEYLSKFENKIETISGSLWKAYVEGFVGPNNFIPKNLKNVHPWAQNFQKNKCFSIL